MSIYDSLSLARPEAQIRLLQRRPSQIDGTDVAWSLQVHKFNDTCPEYIAISYVWGDEASPPPEVLVNEQRVTVRPSCWYALWQMGLRDETSNVPLWIDSICINQRDNAERSAQVAMMGRIFESALFVASCLGRGNHFKSFREHFGHSAATSSGWDSASLYQQFEYVAGPLNNPIKFGTGPASDSETTRAFQRRLKEEGTTEASTPSIYDINHLTYFARMWIIQEVVLARDVRLFCGSDSLTWEDLENAMGSSAVASYPRIQSLIEWRRRRISMDASDQQSYNHQLTRGYQGDDLAEAPNICDLLITCWEAQCSDPRDRIYALLSLLPEDDVVRQNLKVDYNQSLFALIADISPLIWESSIRSGRDNAVIAIRLLLRLFNIGTDCIEEARQFLQLQVEPAKLQPESIFSAHEDPRYRKSWVSVTVLSDAVSFEQVEQAYRAVLSKGDPDKGGLHRIGVITNAISASEAENMEAPRKSAATPSPYGVKELEVAEYKMLRYFAPSDGDGVWRLMRRDYIVRGDVRHGDIAIRPSWLKSNSYWSGPPCAIFRRPENSELFYLHSWGRLSGATSSDFGRSKRRWLEEDYLRDMPLVRFHHTDILAWALIEDWPAEALNHRPICPGASHILLSSPDMERYKECVDMGPAQLQW